MLALLFGIRLGISAAARADPALQKGRRRFSKEEVLAAALVHQAHLLCLLARGQMYDLAAAALLAQVRPKSPAQCRECLCCWSHNLYN